MSETTNTASVKRRTSLRALMFALGTSLLVSACDAQAPSSSKQGFRWSEPSLTGKIVDAETGLPVKGAFVYGHYATSSGTLAGGSKFGEHVRSFAVESDANGVFKLEAWNTGDRLIQGERRGRFPMIAVYKPGYQLDLQHVDSIHHWKELIATPGIPRIVDPRTVIDDTPIDRRASRYPYRLKPAKTERERYDALYSSGEPMMFAGECGWETYSGLLFAQHNELKGWYLRNIPTSELDTSGYPKPTAQLPKELLTLRVVFASVVDRVRSAANQSQLNSRCADPRELFKDAK